MKKLLVGSALVIGIVGSHSAGAQQLAGTTWQGTARVPRLTDVIYQFKRDTLVIRFANTKAALETMRYTQQGSQYTCQKLSGVSPCGTAETGLYKFAITNDSLTITPVLDRCVTRLQASTGKPMKRISWPSK